MSGMTPNLPTVTVTLWRADAVVLFDVLPVNEEQIAAAQHDVAKDMGW